MTGESGGLTGTLQRRVWCIILFVLLVMFGLAAFLYAGKDSNTASEEPQSDSNVDEGFAEYCKTHQCRKNLKVHLKKADGSYFDMERELAQPIVQGDLVTIFPGETIYIAFDLGSEGPENLRSVKSAGDLANILTFKFTQEEKLADGVGMLLFVNNSSKRYIKFALGMQPIDSDKLFKTSSCPVGPEMSGYESWPHPIFQLVITNFHWVDEDNLDCD